MAWTTNKTKFAVDILRGLGAPVTSANLALMLAWQRSEGGAARYNPFNTTLGLPGASSYNSVGVRNYNSYGQGLNATLRTLKNGYYGGIIASLRHGGNPYATAAAIGKSPWGSSGSLIASVLHGMGGFPHVPNGADTQNARPRFMSPGARTIQQVIQFEKKQLGEPYKWGAVGPNAWDCSGIIYAAYRHAGYSGIGRTTYQMIKQGHAVAQGHLLPGDLVFPSTGHVGLYIGNGKVLSSPHTGAFVHITSLQDFGFMTARRLVKGGGGIIPPRGIGGISPSGLPIPQGYSQAQIQAMSRRMSSASMGLLLSAAKAQGKSTLQNYKPPDLQPLIDRPEILNGTRIGQGTVQATSDLLGQIKQSAWDRAGLSYGTPVAGQ